MSTEEVAAPTERELDLACTVNVRKTIRLFFNVPDSTPNSPGEQRLLDNWHKIAPERREAALGEFQRQLWQGLLNGLRASEAAAMNTSRSVVPAKGRRVL